MAYMEKQVTDLRKQVEGLRELSINATQGDWVRSKHCFQILTADSMNSVTDLACPRGLATYPSDDRIERHKADVQFMVACVNFVRAILAEPVEAGAGQIKICALCETPMKLAQGIGYFCPIMGCENRDGLYKLVESREDPPAGEPCRAEIVLKEREDMVSWLNDLNSNWAVLRNTRSFMEGQPKEYWKKFDACMGEAFELQIALMKLATREAGKG